MEDINVLLDELVSIFQSTFENIQKKNNFQYKEERELNNPIYGSLIRLYLTNKVYDIELYLKFNYEDDVTFFINKISETKSISFSRYLKHKEYEKDYILSLNHFEGDTIQERFKKYCDYVVRILETDLKNVVEGKEWIEMPIDWMGYK